MRTASLLKARTLPVWILGLLIVSSVSSLLVVSVSANPDVGDEFTISAEAGVTKRTLDVTWHAATGQFLAVWGEYPDADVDGSPDAGVDGEIRGQLINLDSTLDGGDFLISEGGGIKEFPQVAHIRDTLLVEEQVSQVVWMDNRDGEDDIWGQLVAPGGDTLQGSNFKISGGDPDLFPSLAYGQVSSGAGVFLVVWQRETAADESEVFGQILGGAGNLGNLVGANFQISESSGPATPGDGVGSDVPSVAFDPVNDQFLVVWGDERGGDSEEDNVWGQFVDTNGNLVGVNFPISSQSGEEYAPQVLYHPETSEYLVVWNRKSVALGQSDVHAQLVSPAGALVGGVIDVADTPDQEESGDVAIDPDSGSYVVPLNTGPSPGDRVKVEVQKVGSTGSLAGAREIVSTDVVANKGPIAAAFGSSLVGPGVGVFAVSDVVFAWRDFRSGTGYDVFGRMIEVTEDSDGDGLLDSWETNGYVDVNDNGVLDGGDFDFSTLPAADQPNVNHKDLYVEADWMQVDADGDGVFCNAVGANCDPTNPGDHSHGPLAVVASLPTGTSLDAVVTSFANAPVSNPDGATGISLHIDVGQMGGGGPTPEVIGLDFFGAGAANFEAYKAANFAPDRGRVFHYGVMKHGGSGRGEIWGNDFWLGSQYNTQFLQGIDFMHEFGHNLGLRHNGYDNGPNCAPNYLSIMNYAFSVSGIAPTLRIDYSSQDLLDLDESNLNEGLALGDGIDHTGDAIDQTMFSVGGIVIGPSASTAANAGINWDNDGTPGESGVAVTNNNINNFDSCSPSPANEVMLGFDDWDNIRYDFRNSANFDDNVHAAHDPVDGEALKDFARAQFGVPSLSLSKSGTPAGLPGDPVSYSIDVDNAGPGPARNILVEDTWPAGLSFTGSDVPPALNMLNVDGTRTIVWSVDEILSAGGSVSIAITGTIDFPPAADFVTNTVMVTGQNVLGEPQPQLEDSMVTDIQFPDIEFSKTATLSVNAGEAVTYSLTYENIGDADAFGVVVTDTLPDDVYYSLALDLGAGPQPDSVVANVDGTTTLSWSAGTLTVGSGQQTIEYTARPSLLFLAGDTVSNDASVDFSDANGNDYPAETGSATTGITAVSATGNPRTVGFWRNHQELWDSETLARIQATDQRYDGVDGSVPNGALSPGEVRAAFPPRANVPTTLKMQLLATYFNLATRRINAGTELTSSAAERLGLANVREAVLFAVATLSLPFTPANSAQYGDAILILSGINANVL